jgi:ACR3 family arsenite transporter
VSLWRIARMFLGVPLAAGYFTRKVGVGRKGEDWYSTRSLPRVAPIALWGLLFTVVVLFALQGDRIEVPALVGLVAVARWARRRYYPSEAPPP